MTKDCAKIISVNIGTPKEFDYKGRTAISAIWKTPIKGRALAKGVNLVGDDQADRQAHGGFDKAVYAYAKEDIRWWEEQIGREIKNGEFGENLTTQGIEVNCAVVGERWAIGTVVLEVSEPRIPCWRLGVRMNDKTFPKKFTQALRPGPYFRIIKEGELGVGDHINIVEKPQHGLTVRDVFDIYTKNHTEAARIIDVKEMSDTWKKWAQKKLK